MPAPGGASSSAAMGLAEQFVEARKARGEALPLRVFIGRAEKRLGTKARAAQAAQKVLDDFPVADIAADPLLSGVPVAFEVEDEPYLVQLCPAQQGGSGSVSADIKVLLTMHCTDDEARTERVHGSGSAGDGGSDFLYDDHPALPGTDDTVCVAYERTVGSAGGAVV